jgi:restriction system protein
MARRRSEPSLLETAAQAGWRFNAGLCVAFLAFGYLFVPMLFGNNQFLVGLTPLVKTFALLAAGLFGVMALFKFFGQRATRPPERFQSQRRAVASAYDDSDSVARPASPSWPRIEPRIRLSPVELIKPTQWSLELLRSIEWKRFEEVVAAYFREKNFRCETMRCGADGGVDVRLFFGDMPNPVGVVQCKAWRKQVGVGPVRELLGVMAHEKVPRGYFAISGDYTPDAIEFARTNPIKLVSGADLLAAIQEMPEETQARLLAISTEGDYTTPTCASCGIKLVERSGARGPFWGCRNYPRCKMKIEKARS